MHRSARTEIGGRHRPGFPERKQARLDRACAPPGWSCISDPVSIDFENRQQQSGGERRIARRALQSMSVTIGTNRTAATRCLVTPSLRFVTTIKSWK